LLHVVDLFIRQIFICGFSFLLIGCGAHHRHDRVALVKMDRNGGYEIQLISFPRELGMKVVISNWKKFVAVKHRVKWQRDFVDHRLRDHHELQEKTSYILMNPIRKGLCERVEDWIWVYRPGDRLPATLG
jgi:hypothetical protein